MPIGKVSPAGKSFTGAAEYDLAQGKYAHQQASKKPEILEMNFLSATGYKELGREFRELSNDNKRCQSPVMKFSISFDPQENITDAQKLAFTKTVMREMGVSEDGHQYMITRHRDKNHDHHHILANRIGMDTKVIDVNHSAAKLELSIDKVEKKMGLNNELAKIRRFVYDPTQEKGYRVQKENFKSNRAKVSTKDAKTGVADKKEFIKSQVEKALKQSKTPEEFRGSLQKKSIDADLRLNKENKLTGISFKYGGFSIKGSAMGSGFKASSIEKYLENNKAVEAEKANELARLQLLHHNSLILTEAEKEKKKFYDASYKIVAQIRELSKTKEVDYTDVDQMYYKNLREVHPTKNVWQMVEEHYPGGQMKYEVNMNTLREKLNVENQQYRMKQEAKKLQKKPREKIIGNVEELLNADGIYTAKNLQNNLEQHGLELLFDEENEKYYVVDSEGETSVELSYFKDHSPKDYKNMDVVMALLDNGPQPNNKRGLRR